MNRSLYLTKKGAATFYSWMLCRYLGADTPAGDLANDMTYDPNWPDKNSYEVLYDHIAHPKHLPHGSLEPALRVFDACWKEYQKYLKSYR